ncbi:uncharacterized protein [Malus domestica]|uniref:uncharacterized protein n=1 Tax=Malus domestica TaxID=3750 RepID=UPI003974B8BC
MTSEEIVDWGMFKEWFRKRFIPHVYIDLKKQKFTHLRQGKMFANEYYRMFTDLSRYDLEVAANLVEMLHRFSLGAKKKWRSIVTSTHCTFYQEFYEILLRIKASKNMPNESEDEEGKNRGQIRDDKGKGQAFQGPRKTQNFKRSGGSSSSSSVIIGILRSVGEAAMNVLLMDRWVIGLPNALRGDAAPTPQDSSSTLRILSIRKGILSIREDLCLISHIQLEDLSVTKRDSPSKERLLLVVQDLRDSLPSGVRHGIISAMKAKRLLSKGYQGYLAYVVLNDDTPSSVEDVPVVRYFPDVFLEDLPGLPPNREVEFVIDLLPGTNPISLTPYKMAPAELRELKVQLQELVDKGHVVSAQGIQVDSHKVANVESWEQPRTVIEDVKFEWDSKCEQSFQQLKFYLTHAHVLALPDDNGNYKVYSDASLNCLGCVLMQHGRRDLNLRQRRWIELLSDYDCTIEYHLGRANAVADALSRKTPARLNAIYDCHVRLILVDRVLEAQMIDKKTQEIIQARNQGKQNVKAERKKPFGLMQPLPVPQWKWENIIMDFVYKLLVHIMDMTYHGVPVNIISNRDPRFTSKFWIAFQEALGTRLLYSTAYHSQTDRQSERTIQTLEDMLRSSVLQFGDNPSHVIPPQPLEINSDLTYDEEPVTLLDWKDKELRNKTVRLIVAKNSTIVIVKTIRVQRYPVQDNPSS